MRIIDVATADEGASVQITIELRTGELMPFIEQAEHIARTARLARQRGLVRARRQGGANVVQLHPEAR